MRTIAGLFDSRPHAERAVGDLIDSGVPREAISLITRDEQVEPESTGGAAQTGEGAATGAVAGATAGGLLGLLVGIGALAIPGIGPVLAAGPIAAAIGSAAAGTLVGAAGGAVAGGLVGAIAGTGVPNEQAEIYAEGVRRGGTLVVAQLDDRLVETGARIMQSHNAVDVDERSLEWRRAGWVGFEHQDTPTADATPRYTTSHAEIAGERTSDEVRQTPTEADRVVEETGGTWERSSKAGTAGGTLAGAVTGAGIGAIGGPIGAVVGGVAGAIVGAGIGAAGDAAGESAAQMADASTDPLIGDATPDTDQARMSHVAAAAGGATSTAGMAGGYMADTRDAPSSEQRDDLLVESERRAAADAERRGTVLPDAGTSAPDTTWMETRDRQAPQLPDEDGTWMESQDRARRSMSVEESVRSDADDTRSAGAIRERAMDDTPPFRSSAAIDRLEDDPQQDAQSTDRALGNLDEKWEESSKVGTAGGAVAGATTGAVAGLAGGPIGAVVGGIAGAATGAGLGAGADAAAEGIEDETLGEGRPREVVGSNEPFDRYDATFRSHYQRTGASSGYPYDQYATVYRYGHSLATDPLYRSRSWNEIESDARRRWEASNPNTWERFKDSVRYAWEQVSSGR